MSNKRKLDAKALIREAQLPEKSVPVCLNAHLVAEFEQVERDLDQAQQEARDSLAAGGRARELAERLEALRTQMTDHTIDFRLRAMPRPAWKAFIAEHPPRKKGEDEIDERDRYVGVNTDTFYDALVRRCVIEPELDDDDWALLLEEKLTDRQFDTLSTAAWSLNRRDVDVPFSLAASTILNSKPE